ncbi:hypothetical protein ACJJTC_002612 [Scirpophaga incertulas]
MPTDFTQLNNELYTYEYFLHPDVCRLCWNKEAAIEIDSRTTPIRNCVKDDLKEKIIDCLKIDIGCDNCPRKLCRICYQKVEDFYDFKSFCCEADRRLREIVNSIFSTPIKIEDKIILKSSEDVKGDVMNDYNDSDSLSSHCEDNTGKNIENNRYLLNADCLLKNNSVSTQSIKYDQIDFKINNKQNNKTCQVNVTKSKKIGKHSNIQKEVIHKEDLLKKRIRNKYPKYKRKVSDTYCYACRADFGSKNELATHNLLHGIEGNLFKCFGCERKFTTRKLRHNHEPYCKGLKDGYKCEVCNIFLPLRITYESHMTHHRNNLSIKLPDNLFKCTKCLMSFKSKLLLSEHSVTHNVRRRFICETCGRVFEQQGNLITHRRTHTGVKPYACSHCDSKFAQSGALTVHIRCKHTGERPYSCDLCPQRFVCKSNLTDHRKSHIGQKQYECAACNKRFGRKLSLVEHIAIVHEGSRSFSCEHCGATYTRKTNLHRHLSTKHSKREKTDNSISRDDNTCQIKTA